MVLRVSRVRIAVTVGALIVVGGLLAVPSWPAQAPSGSAFIGFFLAENAIDFAKPTGPDAKLRSLTAGLGTPTTPLLAPNVDWATIDIPTDLNFTSDAVATLWVTSSGNAILNQVDVSVLRGSTVLGRGGTGTYADTNTGSANNVVTSAKVIQLTFGVPLRGVQASAGDRLTIRLNAWGVAAPGTPADLMAVYGSADRPSGLVVAVENAATLPSLGPLKALYLGDSALTFDPVAGPPKTRVSGNTGVTLGTAAEWEWGSIVAPQAMTLGENTPFVMWIKLADSGRASAARGVRANLYIDDAKTTESVGIRAITVTTPTAVTGNVARALIGLPTAGLEIPAGSTIKLTLQLWSLNQAETGAIEILYGSPDRPAGLYLPLAGGPDTGSESSPTETGGTASTSGSAASTTVGTSSPGATTTGGAGTGTNDGTALETGDADRGARAKDLREANELPAWGAAGAALGLVAAAMIRRRWD